MSATDGNVEVPAPPSRLSRRFLLGLFCVLLLVLLLFGAGKVAYRRLARPALAPPDVDLGEADPAVAAAIEQARQGVREEPRSARAWGLLGTLLMVHEFHAAANVCLAEAERLDPSDPLWPYALALGQLAVGNDEAARPRLEQAVALCGDAYDAPRMRLGDVLVGLGRLDEAESHFRLLLKNDPRHSRALLGLARVALQRGNARAALVSLGQPLKDPRTRKAANQLLIQVQHRLGHPAEAEAARRRAADLPDDQKWTDPLRDLIAQLRVGRVALVRQARRLSREGREEEAIELLQQAVREYPNAGDAWFQLGESLLKLKKLAPAESALRRAAELVPTAHEPINHLGLVLVERGDPAGAMKCFRQALALKPESAQAWHNLGNSLMAVGKRGEALQAYRQAVRFAPDLFEAHFALATLLADLGRPAEALVHARYAHQLKPGHEPARKLLSRLEKKPGQG